MRQRLDFKKCERDFRAVLKLEGIERSLRTTALFALVEPLVALDSKQAALLELEYAFNRSEKNSDGYGGIPGNLLLMVLRLDSRKRPTYCAEIAALYDRHAVLDKLGHRITRSVQHLEKGDFTEAQVKACLATWQAAGDQHNDLEIPLMCLEAAISVVLSNPPTDLPLFRLPIEIRQLVRPLLNTTLGVESE